MYHFISEAKMYGWANQSINQTFHSYIPWFSNEENVWEFLTGVDIFKNI